MLRTPKLRQQAMILREALQQAGIIRPHTWVLNTVARMNGARSWGALPVELRQETKPSTASRQPGCIESEQQPAKRSLHDERWQRLVEELKAQFAEWCAFEDGADTEPAATAVLDRRASFEEWAARATSAEACIWRAVLGIDQVLVPSGRRQTVEAAANLQVRRQAAAQVALEQYDFGTEVGEMDGWEYTQPGRTWVRTVYLEDIRNCAAPTVRVRFVVVFATDASVEVSAVYVSQ